MKLTIKSEISRIRKSFPYGKIKKIYEMPNEMIIIKFKPSKYSFKYIDILPGTYYYCPANLFSSNTKGTYQPPWRYTSYAELLRELLNSDII